MTGIGPRAERESTPGGMPAGGWRRDLPLVVLVALALWVITLVPYILAYATAPPGQRFNGFFYLGDDATTYISKMREGAEGAWGWTDRYIASPLHAPVLLFTFYILWGKVAALLHMSMYVGYHLARLSGAIVLVAAAFTLARRVLDDPTARRVAVFLALAGSGLGWMVAALHFPLFPGARLEALDFHLPELSGFYSVLAIPHFAWAAALMVFSLLSLVDTCEARSGRDALLIGLRSGLLMVVLCLIHPQMLFVLGLLTVVMAILWRPSLGGWFGLGLAFVINVPLLFYFFNLLRQDPVIAQWSQQWKHSAPGAASMLLAMGIPLGLAVCGGAWRAGRDRLLLLLVAWVVVVGVLLYLPNPVNIQRRLTDGIYLPIAVLGARGLERISSHRPTPAGARRLRFGLVAVSCMSSMVVLGIGLLGALAKPPYLYISDNEGAAMSYIAHHAGGSCAPPVTVLSSEDAGLYIPARSGATVVVGHYSETLDYRGRVAEVHAAFTRGARAVSELRARVGATYVLYGPRERALSPGTRPADLEQSGLFPIFTSGDVSVLAFDAGTGMNQLRPPLLPRNILSAPCPK